MANSGSRSCWRTGCHKCAFPARKTGQTHYLRDLYKYTGVKACTGKEGLRTWETPGRKTQAARTTSLQERIRTGLLQACYPNWVLGSQVPDTGELTQMGWNPRKNPSIFSHLCFSREGCGGAETGVRCIPWHYHLLAVQPSPERLRMELMGVTKAPDPVRHPYRVV